MDKFGVDQGDPTPEKTAEEQRSCPVCSSPLRPVLDTGVLLCPKCGSKPFEKAKVP